MINLFNVKCTLTYLCVSLLVEAMGQSMVTGLVPDMWQAAAYPSLKLLGSWAVDFLARITFLSDWVATGTAPSKYWISGFFFTQSPPSRFAQPLPAVLARPPALSPAAS